MATTVKHLRGREQQISIDGGHAVEFYLVTNTSWGGDQTFSPLLAQASGLPAVGSPHPAFPYIVCTNIFVVQEMGQSRWKVGVEYGYPRFLTSTEMFDTQWEYGIQGADRTEKIFVALPEDANDRRPPEIGPNIYNVCPPNHNPTHRTRSGIKLEQTGDRRIIGCDRQVKGTQLTLVRRQSLASPSKFGTLVNAHWSLNDRTFLGAVRGTVALADYSIGISASQPNLGKGTQWDLMVVFLWNPIGHQFKAYQTWDDDVHGEEVVFVEANNRPVLEEFKRYEYTDFSAMLASLVIGP